MATSPEAPARTSEPAAGSLKRAISRNMLLVLVVGDVLGAGIYALVGEVGDTAKAHVSELGALFEGESVSAQAEVVKQQLKSISATSEASLESA
jgi:hypothetical protein